MDARSTQTAPTLDYAPKPPIFLRQKSFRRACRIFGIVIVAVTAGKILPTLIYRMRLVYWQNRCLECALPASRVLTRTAGVVPREWTIFYGLLSPPGLKSDGTAFLHERHTPSGERRLLAIDLSFNGDTVGFHPRVFALGSLKRPPVESQVPAIIGFKAGFAAEVEAGEPDTEDPTHLTIVVRCGDDDIRSASSASVIIIDGWVGDDDYVLLQQRSEMHQPTPAPPPASGPSR